jgi:hypothetical protein
MDVKVGPHWYRNSNGIIEIEGLPQIEVMFRPTGGTPIRVNFAIFDQVGKLHAKIEGNSMVINEQAAYRLERSDRGLKLTQNANGKKVIELNVTGENTVEIPEGEFYTLMGHTLKITPREWTVEKTTVGDGETDMKGKAVALTA